jgi:tetratricopeptide (TPR) repeat protein
MTERMTGAAAAALVFGLLCATTPGRAGENGADPDLSACEYAETGDAQIAACTKVLGDKAKPVEIRADALYFRANAYADKGEFGMAIAGYSAAIEIWDYAIFHAARAWARMQSGDLAQALADCDKSISLNANLALGFANRGAIYEKKGNLAKAIADYKAALAIKSELQEELIGQDEAKAALERLGQKTG